jgi:RNA polymerase sigma-70 factor (ECF subfamily)
LAFARVVAHELDRRLVERMVALYGQVSGRVAGAGCGRWQGDRARYLGRRKNLFDLRRVAVVHNLHVIARQPLPARQAACTGSLTAGAPVSLPLDEETEGQPTVARADQVQPDRGQSRLSAMTDEDREFVEFFADEYWPLRRLGYLLTGNWHEADELAQEASARTFAAWRRLRRRDLAAAYARKVLVNRHRSLLRRALVEARHAAVHRQERCEPDLSGDQLLWQALQQLPVRQRTALVLRFYLDLPEAEVARLLSVPPGTVKSWVHRGLARLRQRLGPECRSEPLLDTEARP